MANISENKKLQWFKGHEIDNSTSINEDIIKVSDIVGCEGWALVGIGFGINRQNWTTVNQSIFQVHDG